MKTEEPFEIPETRVIDKCPGTLGVRGITPVHIRELSDKERAMDLKPGDTLRPRFEVRMGFAVLGGCNMTEEDTAACGNNPFHPDYYDNYATAYGNTEEDALEALLKEVVGIGETLW